MTDTTFADLGVSAPTLQAVADLGWETPTPVQARTIPVLLSGKDAMVQAHTGSGKTGAYGIPLVDRLRNGTGLRALVVVPTRELALQVADVLNTLGKPTGFRAFAVYGGTGVERMATVLGRAEPDCIVATPGRLLDLVDKDEVRLIGVRYVVLDEADRMLDMGFLADAERLLHLTRHREVTTFLSATLPKPVRDLATTQLRSPEMLQIDEGGATEGELTHYRINVPPEDKIRALVGLLRKEKPERGLVFVRTRDYTDRVTRALRHAGFVADALHGTRTQAQREHVVDLLRKGATNLMVATDVAARGIDVPEVSLVVNFDLPDDWNVYIHRAGRTGRVGRAGSVFTLVTPDEKRQRLGIERVIGKELIPYRLGELPDFEEGVPPRPARKGPASAGQKANRAAAHQKEALKRAAKAPKKAPAKAPKKAPEGDAPKAPRAPARETAREPSRAPSRSPAKATPKRESRVPSPQRPGRPAQRPTKSGGRGGPGARGPGARGAGGRDAGSRSGGAPRRPGGAGGARRPSGGGGGARKPSGGGKGPQGRRDGRR